MIGHDALRGRNDGDAEAVGDTRHVADRSVDTATGLRDTLDLADDGLALEVLKLDFELETTVTEIRRRVAADVAFVLEDVEHVLTQARARRQNLALATHLRVADTGEHIAQRIIHRHGPCPLTSSTSRGRE